MSGLEIVGVTASILQIAEIGSQLSVKLCTLYRKIKSADQRIESLSNDVALTCNVLRQLGDNLQTDEQAKLYSAEAFGTTEKVLDECKKVFEQISNAIVSPDQHSSSGRFQRVAERIGFLMKEPDLEILKSNLDRLKSTLLLLLNVLIREKPSNLGDLRDLIQTLIEEERTNEEQLKDLTEALRLAGISDSSKSPRSDTPPAAPPPDDLISAELRKYYLLVNKLVSDIDSFCSEMDQTQNRRVRKSVLLVHEAEVAQYYKTHGQAVGDIFHHQLCNLVDRRRNHPNAGGMVNFCRGMDDSPVAACVPAYLHLNNPTQNCLAASPGFDVIVDRNLIIGMGSSPSRQAFKVNPTPFSPYQRESTPGGQLDFHSRQDMSGQLSTPSGQGSVSKHTAAATMANNFYGIERSSPFMNENASEDQFLEPQSINYQPDKIERPSTIDNSQFQDAIEPPGIEYQSPYLSIEEDEPEDHLLSEKIGSVSVEGSSLPQKTGSEEDGFLPFVKRHSSDDGSTTAAEAGSPSERFHERLHNAKSENVSGDTFKDISFPSTRGDRRRAGAPKRQNCAASAPPPAGDDEQDEDEDLPRPRHSFIDMMTTLWAAAPSEPPPSKRRKLSPSSDATITNQEQTPATQNSGSEGIEPIEGTVDPERLMLKAGRSGGTQEAKSGYQGISSTVVDVQTLVMRWTTLTKNDIGLSSRT